MNFSIGFCVLWLVRLTSELSYYSLMRAMSLYMEMDPTLLNASQRPDQASQNSCSLEETFGGGAGCIVHLSSAEAAPCLKAVYSHCFPHLPTLFCT